MDVEPPAGAISSPAPGSCHGPADLPVAVTDTFADQCGSTVTRSYDPPPGQYSSHGDITVRLTAVDGAGNAHEDGVSFTIDTIPPRVTLLRPIDRSVDIELDLPIDVVFTSNDDDGAFGPVVHEVIRLAGCVAYDGHVFGDADGLLRDEFVSINQDELCRIADTCGFTSLAQPEIQVEVTDCGGNTSVDAHRTMGHVALHPGLCDP